MIRTTHDLVDIADLATLPIVRSTYDRARELLPGIDNTPGPAMRAVCQAIDDSIREALAVVLARVEQLERASTTRIVQHARRAGKTRSQLAELARELGFDVDVSIGFDPTVRVALAIGTRVRIDDKAHGRHEAIGRVVNVDADGWIDIEVDGATLHAFHRSQLALVDDTHTEPDVTTCADCKGSGEYVGAYDRKSCPTCDGSGVL